MVFFQDSLSDVENGNTFSNLAGKGGHLVVNNSTFRDSYFSRGAIASYLRINQNYNGVEDTCEACYSISIFGNSYFMNLSKREEVTDVLTLNANGAEKWAQSSIELRIDVHKGFAICLRKFPGKVRIFDSHFLDNTFVLTGMNAWYTTEYNYQTTRYA